MLPPPSPVDPSVDNTPLDDDAGLDSSDNNNVVDSDESLLRESRAGLPESVAALQIRQLEHTAPSSSFSHLDVTSNTPNIFTRQHQADVPTLSRRDTGSNASPLRQSDLWPNRTSGTGTARPSVQFKRDQGSVLSDGTTVITGLTNNADANQPLTTLTNTAPTLPFSVMMLNPNSMWDIHRRPIASTLSINTNNLSGTAPRMTRQRSSYQPTATISGGPRLSETSRILRTAIKNSPEDVSYDSKTLTFSNRSSKSSRHSAVGSPMSPLTIRKSKLEFLTRQHNQPKWSETAFQWRFVLRLLQIAANAGCIYALISCAFEANYSSSIIPLSGIDLLCFTSVSTGLVSFSALFTYLFPAQLSIPPHRHIRISRVEACLELGCFILWLTSSIKFGSSSPDWMKSKAWYICFLLAISTGIAHITMLCVATIDLFSIQAAIAPCGSCSSFLGVKGAWAATSVDPYDENEDME